MENCRYCGPVETFIRERPDTPHGGEMCCVICSAHIKWVAKEKNKAKLEKRPPCPSPDDLKIDRCQLCRRPRTMLGNHETLEIHHLDGDTTNIERINLLVVCSKHHKLIHHEITYLFDHYTS